MTTSASHVILAKETKSLTTPAQKKFNQLKTKVKNLQEKQVRTTQELDTSLQFYYAQIRPEQDTLLAVLIERTKASYQFYKAGKGLSKSELKSLKKLIVEDINSIESMNGGCNTPPEIKEIFSELSGIDYDEMATEKLDFFKESMEARFKEFGADIDLSGIDMNRPQEEVMRDIFRSMGKAAQEFKDSGRETEREIREPKRTKKQQEKELKQQAFVETQKKSISAIYKQLARVLHPDLEQDSQEKVWKEELVKKLTSAYKDNDLYALLSIEMEWVNRSAGQLQAQNDEQFEIYNAILRDQAKTLQADIDMLLMHPKYMPIQRYYDYGFDGIRTLQIELNDIKEQVQFYQKLVERLKTPKAADIFRAAFKEQRAMEREIIF